MISGDSGITMADRATRRTRLPSASLNKAFDNIDRSRKDAIKIFCVECVGGAPGYRGVIRDCTDRGCPLYPWRPYKAGDKNSDQGDGEGKGGDEGDITITKTTGGESKKKLKKKCCDSPDVLKLKEGKRECKNCGKKWKLKKKGIQNGRSK